MSRLRTLRERISRNLSEGPYRAPLAFLATAVLGVVVGGLAEPPTAALANSHSVEHQLIELINQARQDNGSLPPLKLNASLAAAADGHSEAMGQRNFTGHCDPDTGTMPVDRTSAAGYAASWVGENIAWGFPSAQDAFNWWMNSGPHRSNILNAAYREAGTGYHFDGGDVANVRYDPDTDCLIEYWNRGPYYRYYTLTFGRESQVYPVVINREAASADRRSVSLYIYGSGWAEEMRVSNEGASWTGWESYASTRGWTLSSGNGTKTVHVEIRDAGTGSVRSASDTIDLQETSPQPDTPSPTSTSSPAPTETLPPTETPTATATPTASLPPTATTSATPTESAPPAASPSATPSTTPSPAPTNSPTASATPALWPSQTPSPSPTRIATPSSTAPPTATSTRTRTPTPIPLSTSTATPTKTPSPTATPTKTPTPSATPTATRSATTTPTRTVTPWPSPSAIASGSSLAPAGDPPAETTSAKIRPPAPAKTGSDGGGKPDREGAEKPAERGGEKRRERSLRLGPESRGPAAGDSVSGGVAKPPALD